MLTFNKKTTLIIVTGLLFVCASTMPYKAAGILPYTVDEQGEISLLLGLSSVHGNQASDFGGLKDESDGNDTRFTAAREACEELLFVFDNEPQFKRLLELRNYFGKNFDPAKAKSQSFEILMNKLQNGNTHYHSSWDDYVMYFVSIPFYESFEEEFIQRKIKYDNKLPHCWNETTQFAWIKLADIMQAIAHRGKSRTPLKIGNVSLYEPFVQSMITSNNNGIIDAIRKSVQ